MVVTWIVLGLLVGLIIIYNLDRAGWNATGKRISTYIRANIESAKPIKQLEKKHEEVARQDWEQQFYGEVDTEERHEIIKTWYANTCLGIAAHWKCKCGFKDYHTSTDTAAWCARRHVNEQNAGEKLLKTNGGTKAWKV